MAAGLAGVGSLAVAVYRLLVPAEAPAPARDSIAGAHTLGDPAVLEAARAAFTGALGVVAAVCAVLLAGVAVLAAVSLRHVPAVGAAPSGRTAELAQA